METGTWIEGRLLVTGRQVPLAEAILLSHRIRSLWQEDCASGVILRWYRSSLEDWERELRELTVSLDRAGMLEPDRANLTTAHLNQEDWSHSWKRYFHPFRIGERLLIKPSWESIHQLPGDLVIEIDPGMAFGTGLHPSTRLCLELLEQWIRPGMEVVDLGCGSGILALAAARLGAGRVQAMDNDPLAVEICAGNVRVNRLEDQVVTILADSITGAEIRADLLVANLTADDLIHFAGDLPLAVRPGGIIISGGIVENQEGQVVLAFQNSGLIPADRRAAEGWVGLVHLT